ncbi:peptidoglycan-associated lipoprotein Pal [Desulfopila aestuarii]|uniref:Peptidoglycan-associated lipoprotein n=1 Tax=Desulfopila aestuarii DSM 18488 TaxID=1121416 RepID=A0A1M7XZL6_9BACT|nr:peptidoglycan-associated lipoprotein Pal [Desulfopila aestuarii]SHO44603.1 peptidoglycan-associated lipoprotein [Desulfopila aestuarii DSM 18488]
MWRNVRVALPALVCVSLLTLSGCGTKKATDAEMKAGEESLDSNSTGISEGRTSAPMLPVYFEFDASDIKSDQESRIQVNADFLNKKQDVNIRIEGNCDPRGTNEYNMALGERRALAAKKYLMNLGVAESRMSTVSYGEERILLHGHDELSWAQNRRDDFVIE